MKRMPDPTLQQRYDALLLDLDGTLMHGRRPIPGAADAVRAAREAGLGISFATNNASRTPDQVIAHLATVDVTGDPQEVVTSPQIAARLLADDLPAGARVLVVGGPSLAAEIRAVGLEPVTADDPEVLAVVQGWDPGLGWADLAQGAYALRRGARWMATNVDATLPTEQGLAPGNGSLVAALRHATGLEPEVAGKPEPGMFEIAARRLGSARPLVVGDRLDTDIEGGVRAGMDTLLVLTGVSTVQEALHAEPVRRPTWILPDMRGLARPFADALVTDGTARCGATTARWEDGDVVLSGQGARDPEDPQAVRAALALIADRCPQEAWRGDLRASESESGRADDER